MTTKSDAAKAEQQRDNSERTRTSAAASPLDAPVKRSKKDMHKMGPLNAATRLQADAKAGKPDPGRHESSRPDGGEEQTSNAYTIDQQPHAPVSRKSTRGRVPGGQLPTSGLTLRTVQHRVISPAARVARGK